MAGFGLRSRLPRVWLQLLRDRPYENAGKTRLGLVNLTFFAKIAELYRKSWASENCRVFQLNRVGFFDTQASKSGA